MLFINYKNFFYLNFLFCLIINPLFAQDDILDPDKIFEMNTSFGFNYKNPWKVAEMLTASTKLPLIFVQNYTDIKGTDKQKILVDGLYNVVDITNIALKIKNNCNDVSWLEWGIVG
ncbi:hypothetical protein ACFLYH_01795 [Candidatus Dependentiae bacterium]